MLIELAEIFADELDSILFVGGTACSLIYGDAFEPHEGTIDVDFVLNTAELADESEYNMEDKLHERLYQQVEGTNFRWDRRFKIGGFSASVFVDVLVGEYDQTPRQGGSREVQGLNASVLRGMDIAFVDPVWIDIDGELPSGNFHRATIRVCSPASLLVMKGISVVDRKQGNAKDAIDIDYILRGFPFGLAALARVFQTDVFVHNNLVREGLQGIARAFETVDAIGPVSVASTEKYPDVDEREIVRQAAFQRVQYFLKQIGLI